MVGELPWKANSVSDEIEEVMPCFPDLAEQPQGTVDIPRADARDEPPR